LQCFSAVDYLEAAPQSSINFKPQLVPWTWILMQLWPYFDDAALQPHSKRWNDL